ncbi:30S ribosomal protein S19 RpsS [Pantoea ananatis AJ13355]|uniref:30S ribosomal protein S19 RpsS n=1 Tax=Pantoea ananatis (strain AJ13355) TaxID=932677 RepID=A0A0H3L0V7_PANAA|nr:30S ribosomal protein S19 RpsS [Pantoea ananatis AJ13355]
MVKPIMLGKIVERRDQVRKGFLSPLSTAFSTFFSKCRSIKGPFLRERGMAYPLILFATATYDKLIGTLVATGLLTFGLNAPRGYRVLTKVTTFTTTVRVIYWVHRGTTNGRTNTTPTGCTGFTQNAQHMLSVTDFAQCCAAVSFDFTHFT